MCFIELLVHTAYLWLLRLLYGAGHASQRMGSADVAALSLIYVPCCELLVSGCITMGCNSSQWKLDK